MPEDWRYERVNMIVINFFAGPGAGKSTTAAFLFARLKNHGYKVEMAREVAKDLIYEGREIQLSRNQLLITALQYSKLKDLEAHGAEIAISDSPLALGLAYAKGMTYFAELADMIPKLNQEFTNLNVWIERNKPYEQFGRMQDETGARQLDRTTRTLGLPYSFSVYGDEAGQNTLVSDVLKHSEIAQLAEQRALTP